MDEGLLIAMLYYSGIALVAALLAVVVQAIFVTVAGRLGSYLLASVPAIALGAGAIGVVLSKRDLMLNQTLGGMTAEGAGALWITRIANLVLLAMALAKLAQMLFVYRIPARSGRMALSSDQRANRRLFSAFLVYAVCSLILPMGLGTQPRFSHDGLIAVPMFAAAYMARGESTRHMFTSTRWTLLLIAAASLAFAAVMPTIAVSKYLTGLIPGVPVRLWGLASHPNTMGAIAISLMLMLSLSPSPRKWLQLAGWLIALVALFLTQSKTSWLAGLLAWSSVTVYRYGRDKRGRLHIGVWIALLFVAALLAFGLLFVDVGNVMQRFAETDVGSGLSTLTGRTKIWEVAVDMWLDAPWFGYGPDAWSPQHRFQLGVPYATQAHNQLLEALSEGGLVSAVPMIVYFALLGHAALRSAEWTRGISVAFFLVIATRCISEAPFSIGNMTSGDIVLHLVLFMIVVNEAPRQAAVQAVDKRANGRHRGVPSGVASAT